MHRQPGILFTALVVLVCAGAAAAQESPAANSLVSAPHPAATNSVSDATEAIARIRVYRQRRYYGWAMYTSIKVDGKVAVHLDNGRRVTLKLSPGHHVITSNDKKTPMPLDVTAGDEYYIRVDEYPGLLEAQGRLTLILAQQGSSEWAPLKPVGESSIIATDLVEREPAPIKSAKK